MITEFTILLAISLCAAKILARSTYRCEVFEILTIGSWSEIGLFYIAIQQTKRNCAVPMSSKMWGLQCIMRPGICKMHGRFSFILLLTRIPAAMTDIWQARKLSTGFHHPSKIPIFQVDFILCDIYSLLCISCNADATFFWVLVILKDQQGITVGMKHQADLIFHLVKPAIFNFLNGKPNDKTK